MICPNCLQRIRPHSQNQRTLRGVPQHKRCPGQTSYRQMHRQKVTGDIQHKVREANRLGVALAA